MHQFVVTFQDPLLGRAAREAMIDLLEVSREDERVVVSPSGAVLLVEALPDQVADVRRRLASLGATVLHERVTGMPPSRTDEHARAQPGRRAGGERGSPLAAGAAPRVRRPHGGAPIG